ncbi:MAG: helix-turn-helix transcriptional regulator [Clostridiales bacterium]|nr:helix-turn-helix transcriptional regulator [Clostridiales bacterium]
MDAKGIIDRIGYFRTKAKLSQKALSMEIDMNVGYINRLESKRDFLPSVDVLFKIITACGITVEEFFYENVERYAEDKQILAKLKDLSAEKREALLRLL